MPPYAGAVTLSLWATLLAACFVISFTPGAGAINTMGNSLTVGFLRSIWGILGQQAALVVHIVIVAAGVGVLVTGSPVVFEIIRYAGAAYLVYLGIRAFRSGREAGDLEAGRTAPVVSARRTLVEGFAVGVSNPKTIVFFVAVLPQFVDVGAGAVAGQMMVLGVTFLLIALACDSGWALAAGTARGWFARTGRLAAMRRAGGAMLVGLGGTLLLAGNRH